jgi:hypothetical protein
MADQVLVYISAADDLGLEREVLGRAITEIPTTLAWRIVQTSSRAEEPALEAVVQADVHLLLLGSDVRAPVGVEWLTARRSGHMPFLLLKSESTRTQAAQAFMKELERYTQWHTFDDVASLRKQVLTLLSDHILTHRDHYQLGDNEYEKLSDWLKNLRKAKRKKVDDTRGGADKSSIILSTERYVPSEGVLLHDPNRQAPEEEEAEG